MRFLYSLLKKQPKGVYLYKKRRVKNFSIFYGKLAFVPFIFIVFGLSLITWVIWPILSFQLFLSPKFSSLIRPIPDEIIVQAMENEERILGYQPGRNKGQENASGVLSTEIDYTKASNWFPQKPPEKRTFEEKEYTLSIPKLKIKDARVIIGGEDLGESLIHYGGTALPGDWGKTVIFGHSVLPQFFNPKNYKTIFSTLPTLEKRDEILVNFDGVTYTYEVFDLRVVSPDDISVLEQRYDSSYLSLVTCVPPGTYWKRLIVMAGLKKI